MNGRLRIICIANKIFSKHSNATSIGQGNLKIYFEMDLGNCIKFIHATAAMLNDIWFLSFPCIFKNVLTDVTYFPNMYIMFREISRGA